MKRCEEKRHTDRVEIERLEAGGRSKADDTIVAEVPFTISLNGVEVATLLCCPSDLTFLAAGYLLSEGFIDAEAELSETVLNEKGYCVHVTAKGAVQLPQGGSTGRLVISGCGQCRIPLMHGPGEGLPAPISSGLRVSHKALLDMMDQFLRSSALFRDTGAVHSCAICDRRAILYRADDIGRHNALDKVIGWSFIKGMTRDDKVLLITGRASSEMVLKAVRAGVPVLVSHSAATTLGVDLAKQLGCTLIGFARGQRMNIYSHGFRVR